MFKKVPKKPVKRRPWNPELAVIRELLVYLIRRVDRLEQGGKPGQAAAIRAVAMGLDEEQAKLKAAVDAAKGS